MPHHTPDEEKMILAHDPVPGYRPAFLVVFALGVLYLAWILLDSL
jgi:hypothetical protein